jgi:anti-sigma regulatory factor (Ser/Thr protein kinase)
LALGAVSAAAALALGGCAGGADDPALSAPSTAPAMGSGTGQTGEASGMGDAMNADAPRVPPVFANGVKPENTPLGPLGFQPDVFDSAPGDPDYTPLRRIVEARWSDDEEFEVTDHGRRDRAGGVGREADLGGNRGGGQRAAADMAWRTAMSIAIARPAHTSLGNGVRRRGPRTPTVSGDPALLAQVLENLLANALRYTPPEGRVQLRARAHAAAVTIAVEDTGIGIPQDAIPHVFERFYRVDHSRTGGTGGTGIGLAIVKHLVERHDGDVWITSELGAGTRVTFRLPAASGNPTGSPPDRGEITTPGRPRPTSTFEPHGLDRAEPRP